jgi:Fur family transcriptional regulator, ferric uptake regulator
MAVPPTDTTRAALHSANRRLTGQRQLLLELIAAQPGHIGASELYLLAQQCDPQISLSTVYRTLRLLRNLGLVDELHLDEEHHHYELKPATAHHHLICLGCGQVLEFSSPLVQRLVAAVARAKGYQITETRIDLTGYCACCQTSRREVK